MFIRQEVGADVTAIDAVHVAAFGALSPGVDPVEGDLVRGLRADSGWIPELSLVAERPTGDSGAPAIVGHVVCSRGSIDDLAVLGLGPLGVLPKCQGEGIGAAVMHAVLAAADALDFPAVVLLGHLGYYPRCGFVPAAGVGITPTDPAWKDHFQARTLRSWSPTMAGEFRYAAPFYSLRDRS